MDERKGLFPTEQRIGKVGDDATQPRVVLSIGLQPLSPVDEFIERQRPTYIGVEREDRFRGS